MGLIFFLIALPTAVAAQSFTLLQPAEMAQRLRLSDRNQTSNILGDIFLGSFGKAPAPGEALHFLIYSRFEAFSGPCYASTDSFCPKQRGFYEMTSKHSVVREGYRLQACGSLAGEPENIRRALMHAGLQPSDELSAGNLVKAFGIFYPDRKVGEADLSQTMRLMAKLQHSEGREKAWQKYLALLCDSVGWQVY